MESIILPKNLNLNKITYGSPRTLDNGGKVIYIGYEGKPLIIQTPEMHTPFGLSKWSADSKGPEKYTLELSFKGRDSRDNLNTFYEAMRSFDKKLVGDALDNSTAWLKKKFSSREVLEALYTPVVKFAKDKMTGELTDRFPPTFRITLPQKDGQLSCEAYNNKREEIDLLSTDLKGAKVTAIMQCMGIWVAGGKFGCSWKAVQLKVVPQQTIKGFAFMDVDGDVAGSDIEDNDATGTPKPNTLVEAGASDDLDDEVYVPTSDEEDNDDLNDSDVVPPPPAPSAPLPPASGPAKRRAPAAKKS